MLDILVGLKRVLKRDTVLIDNTIFRFHWFLTVIVLIAFSSIITARQYVGVPIDCLQVDDLPETILNTFCWIHSTYTLPEAYNKRVGYEVPYPGVDNSQSVTATKHDTDKKFTTYYQWISFVLFTQSIFFYIPYYLWKQWEGGMMRAITMGMNIAIISDEERGHKKRIILDYFYRHMSLNAFRWYAFKYFFCELLCLLNLIAQIWITDQIFGGKFLTYGIDVITFVESSNPLAINPMFYLFPRMTKCEFRSYGSSGDIQKYDALCMLPLNVFNEKIYIFLWFWFAILLMLTTTVVLYRAVALLTPSLRPHFLQARCRLSHFSDLELICREGNIGDWFILYQMGKNLDPIITREITENIARKIQGHIQDGESVSLKKGIRSAGEGTNVL